MANRTVKDAHTVHGTNPQYLVEKIIRSRIYECRYWKEECFAVNEELLVERAVALKYIGGVHSGNIKPTPFLCLILKMLQIQPAKDIIIEFIRQKDHKYARALGMFYLRLTQDSLECYRYLEPLYNDYRKLKRIDRQGAFSVIHMDEFVDELLREERSCDVILPRLQKRQVLEEESDLEPRVSLLDEELQDVRLDDAAAAVAGVDSDESDDDDNRDRRSHSDSPPRRRSSVSPPAPLPSSASRHPNRHRRRSRTRSRSRSRSPPPPHQQQRDRRRRSRSRSKSKSRSRSPAERRRRTGGGTGDSEAKKKRKKDKKDRSAKAEQRSKDRDKQRDKDRSERKRPRQDPDDRGRDREQRNRNREEEEIREANKLRAELGIPLLKP